MGYYVRIEEAASNFKIKKENFERGYEIMCDLNKLFNSSCGSLVEVLELLDFGVEYDDAGNISGLSYDDKSGCEETFLNALKPVIEEGSYLVWVGEEGEQIKYFEWLAEEYATDAAREEDKMKAAIYAAQADAYQTAARELIHNME